MNQRERVLAIAVGSLGVLLGGQYGLTVVRKQFEIKQAQVEKLTKEVDDKQMIIDEGIFSSTKLQQLKPSSLPTDVELARKQYMLRVLFAHGPGAVLCAKSPAKLHTLTQERLGAGRQEEAREARLLLRATPQQREPPEARPAAALAKSPGPPNWEYCDPA